MSAIGPKQTWASAAADPVLAPSGTLHAAYIVTNVAQARPATGTVSGVIADIARELARRANERNVHFRR